MYPYLAPGETPVEFVAKQAPQLLECSCSLMNRACEHNARNFLDGFVVELFQQKNWPKDKPIKILDVGSGGLKQLATLVTSLLNSGYKVELVLVDAKFQALFEDNESDKASKVKEQVGAFRELLKLLNDKTQTDNAAVLTGVFSSLDSFQATRQGQCLQYEHCDSSELLREKVSQGISRRYLSTALGRELVGKIYGWRNRVLEREYEANKVLCRDLTPDLITVIDDVTEFHPMGVERLPYVLEAPPGMLEFAFNNEVVRPFTHLPNPPAILYTQKINRNGQEKAKLRIELLEESNPKKVLYEYEIDSTNPNRYKVVSIEKAVANNGIVVLPQLIVPKIVMDKGISDDLQSAMTTAIGSLSTKWHLSGKDHESKNLLLMHYQVQANKAQTKDEIKGAILGFIKIIATPRRSCMSFFTSAYAETASAKSFSKLLEQNQVLQQFIYSLIGVAQDATFKDLANVAKVAMLNQAENLSILAQQLVPSRV